MIIAQVVLRIFELPELFEKQNVISDDFNEKTLDQPIKITARLTYFILKFKHGVGVGTFFPTQTAHNFSWLTLFDSDSTES